MIPTLQQTADVTKSHFPQKASRTSGIFFFLPLSTSRGSCVGSLGEFYTGSLPFCWKGHRENPLGRMKCLTLMNRGVRFASIPGDLRLLAMYQGAVLKTPARTLQLVPKSYCLCSFRAGLVKTCLSAPRQCPEFRKITFFTLVGLGYFVKQQ